MEDQNNKRVLSIELDNEVKKVSITGLGSDEKVVMQQELNEDDLDVVAGGVCRDYYIKPVVTIPSPLSCKRHE